MDAIFRYPMSDLRGVFMADTVLHIGIDKVIPDPTQPRKTFLKEELERLAASIAARGVMLPLRVIPDAERAFWRIVSGECRWRAAKLAGLATVPCLPVEGELSETDILSDQIIENTVRHSLLPLELAKAMSKLKALKGCNSQALAAELGISGASICRAESLLSLPQDVQALIDDGRLVESAAYEVSRLPDADSQRDMANLIVASRLNRDQVIEAVRQKVGKKHVAHKAGRVAGKLDGVSFTFSFSAGELTPETLLKAIEQIRSRLKEMQRSDHRDVSALADLLRAS
jgi:ParB family transcriptional regulator, chromosome partitioning protein